MAPLAVLGIDAAWTARHASGVALVTREGGAWRLVAVAPSYVAFCALADGVPVDWAAQARGSMPDPPALLAAAEKLLGAPFHGVISVDMPLATVPITRRRAADNALSRAFGACGCGVHSSTAARPGPVSEALRGGFARLGFPLATTAVAENCVIEVYPHIAVMALLGERYRVPYKLARARQYWPDTSPEQRRRHLVATWARIRDALRPLIAGLPELPPDASKPSEDGLDALVCAWIGMEFLAGRAEPYGDETAAIWAPQSARGATV